MKLPARVSQVRRTAESPRHKQTAKHTLCFAASTLHTTRKHMSECIAGPIFSFLFLIGAGEMCRNKGRTSVRSLLCNTEMSHVARGIIT